MAKLKVSMLYQHRAPTARRVPQEKAERVRDLTQEKKMENIVEIAHVEESICQGTVPRQAAVAIIAVSFSQESRMQKTGEYA